MTKQEYIEKNGEEWYYSVHLPRLRKAAQKYHHSEKGKNTNKKWYEENKERIKLKNSDLKEEKKEYNKQYNITNKDKISGWHKEYYKSNIEARREYNKQRYATKEGKATHMICDYRRDDKKNKRGDCTLSKKWIIEKIFNSSCIYCGDSDWTHLGADRIDNNLPHTPENCVCACGICNCEREGRKMSVAEFVEYRKNHPRFIDLKPKVVDVDGIKVIRKP